MLTITLPGGDRWDETLEEFIISDPITIQLEHSLVSLSKWEEVYKKPFLGREEKTPMELFDYIKMMCLTQGVSDEQWYSITPENIETVKAYIDEKRTATIVSKKSQGGPNEPITSELIYCWMVQGQIPFETQHWHLSRLLTLINVVAIKNQPPKKTSQADAVSRHRAIKQAHRSTPHVPHVHKP